MNILLIAAHGSRKEASNKEVESLATRLALKLSPSFDRVEHAFLQFADPLLETTLDALASETPHRIVVFPFFIGSGSHITEDIPELVKSAAQTHPSVTFELTNHLGKIQAIDDLIANEALKNLN